MSDNSKPVLGVSSCLLGHPVRFDGGHKRQRFIVEDLSRYFDFRHTCPEIEIGLGTPRPTIQLRLSNEGQVRLVDPRAEDGDLTGRMNHYAKTKVEQLDQLDGYIFKKSSPSCGMERVPVVVNSDGYRTRDGVGLFARAFMERWPLVPVEDEGRLNDPVIRENFFERVYAFHRWRTTIAENDSVEAFIRFHARHKLQIMARGSQAYKELGRLVAGATKVDLPERKRYYIERFMQVMSARPKLGHQVNVLQHLLGYYKRQLNTEDKQELLDLFEGYRRNEIPLITPLTLLRHHQRRCRNEYIAAQHYLSPFPESLALRSYIRA